MLTKEQDIKAIILQGLRKINKLPKKFWKTTLVKLVNILLPTHSIEELFPDVDKLSPVEPESVATPEVKQMNLVQMAKYLQSDKYTIPAIYTYNLRQVIYYPKYDLLLTESKKLIREASYGFNVVKAEHRSDLIKHLYYNNFRNSCNIHTLKEPEKIVGVCSLVSEYFKNNHYHTLIDVAPKLYLLNQPEYQDIDEIKLLFSKEPTSIEKFLIDKLAPTNAEINIVEKSDSIYFVENLIFPTLMSRICCGYLPSVYIKYFRDKVLPKRESKKVNRIFISRAKAKRRRIINEDELFDALKPHGFKKYFLEDLSIEAEIEIFYDADYVVGIFGAGLTNMIFSKKIKVLELSPSQFFDPCFYYLAKSLRHTYGYCNGYCDEHEIKSDILFVHGTDFRVNVSEVIEKLLELERQHQNQQFNAI